MKKIVFWIIQLEAKIVLRKYKPRIIAITGSVGKTSAKNAIYDAINSFYYAGKSQKSYNTEIGIPLTILGKSVGYGNFWRSLATWLKNIMEGILLIILPNVYPKWLVVEAGIDQPGDMDLINKWLNSDIVVFTRFAQTPAHVEFFDSPSAVMNEKKKLIKSLKDGGVLVLNADDEDILEIKKGSGKHVITFGFGPEAEIKASNLEIIYQEGRPYGINFKVNINGASIPIILEGVLGVQHVYPVLAAFAVGKALNLNILKLSEVFRNNNAEPSRMRILDGVYGSILIDDSYNSSPVAMKEALNVLGQIKGQRKIAVLGDMLELGKYTKEEHQKVGRGIVDVPDILVLVGKATRDIAESAKASGFDKEKIYEFKNTIEAGEFMKDFIKKEDIVLIKGSQSIRLEKIVSQILARPEEARFLLVRQSKEWQEQ